MKNALCQKIKQLVHGDDGAALVITLALFMMMYIACAGVFAIGQSVKEKMILQNAADAAAYSAAIVQADTLSRIATINRAMAWTYKAMVLRQMDYVTRKWVEESLKLYASDADGADWIGGAPPLGYPLCIKLNGGTPELVSEVGTDLSSVDSLSAMKADIDNYRASLRSMNDAEEDLLSALPGRISEAVHHAVEANLPGRFGNKCIMKVRSAGAETWKNVLTDVLGADEENRFLEMEQSVYPGSNVNSSESRLSFKSWFPIGSGIVRSYESGLVSEWWVKKGFTVEHKEHDASEFHDAYYDGDPVAAPRVLTKSYFYEDGGDVTQGAISVAIAKEKENPWTRLVDLSAKSLYDVFTPSGAAKWTWAVASAHAGYRPFHATGSKRDYSLDYEEKENLRTDDWDAVFFPVCRSFKADDFSDFITKADGWEKVNPSSGIDPASYDASSLAALPSMHNSNGSMKDLEWGEILMKMYH